MDGALIVLLVVAVFVLFVVYRTAVVVPQQSAYVVERLGRYHATMNAGFHLLMPFVDVIRYRHSLKETAWDIAAQVCITRDNVQVGVDGILYLKVLNPERASYGISDYLFAITQLAQTTLRSEVGKIDLDRTFEERGTINTQVVSELDKASEAWGVKVLRYEIKNITPPQDVLAAMEKQMRAEREKRAVILTSEGQRDAAINNAEGAKQQVIKASEANRQQQINEAEGQAQAILAVASATAEGIRRVAEAIRTDGGMEAVQLRVAEQYVEQFGNLAKNTTSVIVPASVSDMAGMIAAAMKVFGSTLWLRQRVTRCRLLRHAPDIIACSRASEARAPCITCTGRGRHAVASAKADGLSTRPERYRSGRNGGASKASCPVRGTWVRIPPSPPAFAKTLASLAGYGWRARPWAIQFSVGRSTLSMTRN
jgi:regulator of protease activity HflC (stomatin/prohibitin superfamily)